MREEIKDVLRATNRLLVSQAAIREEIKEEIRTTNRLLGHMVAVQALTLGTVVLTAALVWRTGKS
ncbi:hypothetical protein Q8F55_006943 [Vanrija albida]|uniref:GOLD domain-containing protein n=1 Tax=Vanrija albida TaxID=181172 RepID=A0ABR3PYQ0_9TREE